MERVDFWRAIRFPMPKTTIRLEGGPHDGWTHEYDLAPDLFEMPTGRYLPYLTTPTVYRWMPHVHEELP
jgi:hypothetical protein